MKRMKLKVKGGGLGRELGTTVLKKERDER